MFLNKLFSQGRKEQKVTAGIADHLRLLGAACEAFHQAVHAQDRSLARRVPEMEREADVIRREIIGSIYDGAFLPYLRPDLCKFVTMADEVFDLLQETANHFLNVRLPDTLCGECVRVALLNWRMCELLAVTYQAMLDGRDLKEKTLGLRIYEKKVDDIKFGLMRDMMALPVTDFWQGRLLAEFIDALTRISDRIEDASDQLEVIHVSMR